MVENNNEIEEKLRIKLGNYIEELREKKGYTFNQLALKSGVNVKSLNEIKFGKSKKVNPFHLQKIAKALNIDYKELYKIVGYLDEDKNEIIGNIDLDLEYKKVPLYSSISAGYGACESDVIDYIALPMVNAFSGDVFAVRVNGDSMEHTIENHSIVFIRRDSEVVNKKIGAFLLNNEALLKRYYVTDSGIFLRSDNREYPDIRVREHDDFVIVGRYIGSVINEDEI
ncbi:helix-turn-helix domain-containing protein [Fusobacterium mortiferum]|uniref:Helix-turn-helix domain-containing protein n=1 Tax=Fusobacterium mortiferum TaxID=850 RepID=A0A414PUT3_FUSMR|nr:XRE family transcriptional regulator [Fusobacterium mortiferum]RHF72333.1 helix-turn-helix domain-containing protein [Fusobacterium mortiferum]